MPCQCPFLLFVYTFQNLLIKRNFSSILSLLILTCNNHMIIPLWFLATFLASLYMYTYCASVFNFFKRLNKMGNSPCPCKKNTEPLPIRTIFSLPSPIPTWPPGTFYLLYMIIINYYLLFAINLCSLSPKYVLDLFVIIFYVHTYVCM